MCLFNYANNSIKGKAYKRGITHFECGGCPECLAKRSRAWCLRACMEAKVSQGMMLTLTYDDYERDKLGNIIGEKPADTRVLSKRDCQLFIKRLRKHFNGQKLKYIIGAEHGKRTGRSHYHCVIFGVQFNDCHYYKKSKRGNVIYKSPTLDKIWSNGICTVDSMNINASIARYCTKYCAKDNGADDTFMLFSRGIGNAMLLEKFNGLWYMIEGRKYPIPRQIWQKFIENKYNIHGYSRYVGRMQPVSYEKRIQALDNALNKAVEKFRKNPHSYNAIKRFKRLYHGLEKYRWYNQYKRYERQAVRRSIYENTRDNDVIYKRYIAYWKKQFAIYELQRPNDMERIAMLDDKKYWKYKAKAMQAKLAHYKSVPYTSPRANGLARFYNMWYERNARLGIRLEPFAEISRYYTANDTDDEWIEANAGQIRTMWYDPATKKSYIFAPTDEKSPFLDEN